MNFVKDRLQWAASTDICAAMEDLIAQLSLTAKTRHTDRGMVNCIDRAVQKTNLSTFVRQ